MSDAPVHKRPNVNSNSNGKNKKKKDETIPLLPVQSIPYTPSAERKTIFVMKTSQCLQFKVLFDCLKDLLTEVNFNFTEKCIKLICMDPGRIGMIHLEINNVEHYECAYPIVAGMYVGYLYKMMRSMNSGDFMEWRIYEDDPNALQVLLINSDKRTRTTNTLKLLDLDIEEIEIPNVKFDRVISMPSSDLSRYIREVSSISNTVTIRGTDTTLEILASGDIAGTHIIIEPTASGLNWLHSEPGGGVIEGTYFVKYIEKFTKACVDASVELFLRESFPLIMRYEMVVGTLRFVIATLSEN